MVRRPHSRALGVLTGLWFAVSALTPAAPLSAGLEPTTVVQPVRVSYPAPRTAPSLNVLGGAARPDSSRAGGPDDKRLANDGRRNEDISGSRTAEAQAEISVAPEGMTSTQRSASPRSTGRTPREDNSRDAEASEGEQHLRSTEDLDKETSPWADNDDVTAPQVEYDDYEEPGEDAEDDAFNKKELSTESASAGQVSRGRKGHGPESEQEKSTSRGRLTVGHADYARQEATTQPRDHVGDAREKSKDADAESSMPPSGSVQEQDASSKSHVTGSKYEKIKSRNRPKWLSRPAMGPAGDGESPARMRSSGVPGAKDQNFDSASLLSEQGLRDNLRTRHTDSLTPDLTTEEPSSHTPRRDPQDALENSANVRRDLALTQEGRQGLPAQEHHHDSTLANSTASNTSDPSNTSGPSNTSSPSNTSGPRDDKWPAVKHKKPAYGKGCPECERFDAGITEARNLRLQVLRDQLLDKLRMVPRFKYSPWPPKLPDQVFPDYLQQDEGDANSKYYARTTEVIVFGRDLDRHRLRRDATGSYQLGVTGKVKGSVSSAELWVYKMADANDMHGQTLLVTELDFRKGRHLQERSLVARAETRVQEGWISFDVTRLVQRWEETKPPASTQLLAIRCKTCARTNYRAIFGAKSNFRPVLVMHIQSAEEHERTQRSTCDPNFDCCKFDLFVHFRDLGIHEVFYPRTIKADYCYGSCDRPDVGYYRHSQLMQNFRWNNDRPVNSTLRERLKPCCVPVVLRQTSIMYYTNNGLDTEVSSVPNILVDKCGCA